MHNSSVPFTGAHCRWLPMALCLQYNCAHFDGGQLQQFAANGAVAELTANWAVGVLSDCDWKVLGVLPGVAVGCAFWPGICEDLCSRAVDRNPLVCASDLDAWTLCLAFTLLLPFRFIPGQGPVLAGSRVGVLPAEVRRLVQEASGVRAARFASEQLRFGPGEGRAGALSPGWLAVPEQFRPVYALRPHRRALVCEGDRRLEQLGGMLARAVRCHGTFADMGAAVSFVAWTLARCAARIEWAELPPLSYPSHPVGRAMARAAAGAAVRSELDALVPALSV